MLNPKELKVQKRKPTGSGEHIRSTSKMRDFNLNASIITSSGNGLSTPAQRCSWNGSHAGDAEMSITRPRSQDAHDGLEGHVL